MTPFLHFGSMRRVFLGPVALIFSATAVPCFPALANSGQLPTPAAKVIARLQTVNSVTLRYVMVDHSLMSTKIKRDTFWLEAWGIQSPGKLRVVIQGNNNPTYYRDGIYASLAPRVKKVWYDTLPDSELSEHISWKIYTPAFNRGSRLASYFHSNTVPRAFDTTVGTRTLHGYDFTLPLDDPSDTMIGPTTVSYLVDDDSNLVSYSNSGVSFHRWIANGAELLDARYNTLSQADLDHTIDSIKASVRKNGYGTFKHSTAASYTASLPKPGTMISIAGKTPEGDPIRLGDIKSKLVLVDFWYSGCGYCRYALPFLRSMQEKYKDSGLTVVGIDPYDNEPKIVQQVIQTEALKNPEIIVQQPIADSLGVKAYPTFIFLDQNDRVLASTDGYEKSMEPKLEGLIESNLAKAQ